LKKQSPKQKGSRSSNPLWHYIILVGFIAFSSCNHQPATNIQNETSKKPQPINGIKRDIFAAPKIIPITVSVSTKRTDNKITISVIDNGNGLPQKVLDKIFQPFFTTKPTGQGTGLGLSMSYDIIKAHGGELKVESKEGEGAEFIILIPVA
jgi:LytS/YehU family sensor histidine kinase